MAQRTFILAALSAPVVVSATAEGRARGNPVRKVVNLLHAMEQKVKAEGEKADELYKKFMCYCENSGGDLQASINAAGDKIPQMNAAIEAASQQKTQLKADLKAHQTDRRAAEDAMAEATALREKEEAAFDKALAENKANLGATKTAEDDISKGMEASFLQTNTAEVFRNVVNTQKMNDGDRQELLSFLAGPQSGDYAPASMEISGILKTMADEMAADQKDMIATEKAAVEEYEKLMAAKKKEAGVLQKAIEEKMQRVGDLSVEIATLKDDAGDTAETLAEDQKFAKDLKKNCAEKTGLHEQEQKVRGEELVALADTIKLLNDDDALDLFKKTLPSASSSFLQVQRSGASLRAEARALLANVRSKSKGHRHHLDFILLALNGRKVGFEKISKLIDNLVAIVKKEQANDDDKKEYCEAQFDQTEDKKKGLTRTVSDVKTVIAEAKDSIATFDEEIAALKAGIVALDKQVKEAMTQRLAEKTEHKELMQSSTAAKELLLFAKNRLNKFYNPRLYKAPPKRELSEGDQIYENNGGDIPEEAPGGIANTGISAFVQVSAKKEAPPPPPATAAAYKKKGEESNGVIAMIDLLVQDLDREMTVAQTEETNAIAEYEQTVADASDKRRQDSRSLTDKEAAVADAKSALEKAVADKKSATKELMILDKVIMDLHGECDWLLKYAEVREEGRTNEIDSLGKAKDVLNGADYSLLQQSAHTRKFLRHQ